jgi:hypothetical protein
VGELLDRCWQVPGVRGGDSAGQADGEDGRGSTEADPPDQCAAAAIGGPERAKHLGLVGQLLGRAGSAQRPEQL